MTLDRLTLRLPQAADPLGCWTPVNPFDCTLLRNILGFAGIDGMLTRKPTDPVFPLLVRNITITDIITTLDLTSHLLAQGQVCVLISPQSARGVLMVRLDATHWAAVPQEVAIHAPPRDEAGRSDWAAEMRALIEPIARNRFKHLVPAAEYTHDEPIDWAAVLAPLHALLPRQPVQRAHVVGISPKGEGWSHMTIIAYPPAQNADQKAWIAAANAICKDAAGWLLRAYSPLAGVGYKMACYHTVTHPEPSRLTTFHTGMIAPAVSSHQRMELAGMLTPATHALITQAHALQDA